MPSLRFTEPVVVRLDSRRPEFGTKDIQDVQDALAALHRFGMGDWRLDENGRPRREWALAAASLVKARTEPTPANVEAARRALCAVARLARILVTEPAGSPLQKTLGLWRASA